MNAKVENLTHFAITADALELTPKEREAALALTQKLGIPLFDAGLTQFVAIIKSEGQIARLEAAISELHSEFRKDADTLLSKVQQVLAAELKSQISTVPALLEKQMGDITKIVAREVNSRLNDEASRRQKHRQGMLAAVAALVVLLAFGQGYIFGSDAVDANASKWEAIAKLEDGGTWLGLAQNNDIKKVLAQSCGLGERRVQAGGEKCDLSLWLTPPVATSKGADTIRLSFVEWTNWLGVWGLLGIGALFGYVFRSVRR